MASIVDSTVNAAGTGTAITVAAPAGLLSGDVVVFIIHSNSNRTITDNNGATPAELEYTEAYNTSSAGVGIWTRVCGGSEPVTYAFTASGSDRWSIIAILARGIDTAVIWDVAPSAATSNVGSDSSAETHSLITVADGAIAIAVGANDSATISWTGTPADGFTNLENSSGSQLLAADYKIIPTATTQAAVVYTGSGANPWLTHLFSLVPAATENLTATVSEVLDLTDALTRISRLSRTVTQSLVLTDTVTSLKRFVRTVSETLTLTDVVTRIQTGARSVSDTLRLTDSVTRIKLFFETIEETVHISKGHVANQTATVSETLLLSESITRQASFSFTEQEVLTLTDLTTALKLLLETIEEVISLTESHIETLTFTRTITDTLRLTDITDTLGTTIREIVESLHLTDTVTSVFSLGVVIQEVLTLTDSLLKKGWSWTIKNTSSWIFQDKNDSVWSSPTKHSASWTPPAKHSSTWNMVQKSASSIWTFINKN